jgi:hypothetical protein
MVEFLWESSLFNKLLLKTTPVLSPPPSMHPALTFKASIADLFHPARSHEMPPPKLPSNTPDTQHNIVNEDLWRSYLLS